MKIYEVNQSIVYGKSRAFTKLKTFDNLEEAKIFFEKIKNEIEPYKRIGVGKRYLVTEISVIRPNRIKTIAYYKIEFKKERKKNVNI